MEVTRETIWKWCLSTPTKPLAKNSNICLSATAYQQKGTGKKWKKTTQAPIIQWQWQCLMGKPHRKAWPKSKIGDIFKQSPSPLHHTFLLGRARFTTQPLSTLVWIPCKPEFLRLPFRNCKSSVYKTDDLLSHKKSQYSKKKTKTKKKNGYITIIHRKGGG